MFKKPRKNSGKTEFYTSGVLKGIIISPDTPNLEIITREKGRNRGRGQIIKQGNVKSGFKDQVTNTKSSIKIKLDESWFILFSPFKNYGTGLISKNVNQTIIWNDNQVVTDSSLSRLMAIGCQSYYACQLLWKSLNIHYIYNQAFAWFTFAILRGKRKKYTYNPPIEASNVNCTTHNAPTFCPFQR